MAHECGFVGVAGVHRNLMKAGRSNVLNHDAPENVVASVNSWQRISVLLRYLIEAAVVDAKPGTSVFLLDDDDVRRPLTLA